ncbi:MAG: hypothetical protein R3F11_09810 [Verrucomicrobiales bacterium]
MLTDVAFEAKPGSHGGFQLASLQQPVTLSVPGAIIGWSFWMRDLPLEDGSFDRASVRSAAATDVNDPDARAADRDYPERLRMAAGRDHGRRGDAAALLLCGLWFPLQLESASAADGRLDAMAVIRRLQLPLDRSEIEDAPNSVRLRFARSGARLALKAVEMVDTGEAKQWPLALRSGEQSGAPRLR